MQISFGRRPISRGKKFPAFLRSLGGFVPRRKFFSLPPTQPLADAWKLSLHHRPSGAIQTRPPDPENASVRKPSRQTMTRTPASCTFRTMRQSQEFVQRTTRTPAFRTVHSIWKRIAGGRSWWSVCYFNRHLITSYHCSPDRIDIPHLTHGLLTTLYFWLSFLVFLCQMLLGKEARTN